MSKLRRWIRLSPLQYDLVARTRSRRTLSTAVDRVPQEKLVKVIVNGKEVQVPATATIMQACALAGVDVPRFCYHERLGIAGNCRMCLVQVNEGPKLVASCAAPIMPDARIATESLPVKKAREGVMEFLLANHPLDCPVCDQGGECDLQDQAMAFGSDRSRFQIDLQDKRAVEDKDFGPLIKTSMNRCIHCTRCVRFANEVAGVQELGTTGRGNDMQIGTYVHRMLDSPLSGNIIDLCPVGALTSKPYAFTARPWELRRTDSIDVLDAMGAAIKVDSRGMEVMRILPRLNEDINEEWLADKGRFSYDALRRQRLVQPLIRTPEGELIPVSWEEALEEAAEKLQIAKNPIGVIGRFADVESSFLLGKLLLPNTIIDEEATHDIPVSVAKELRFNSSIGAVEDADAIVLIGADPRKEAPLLDGRIRKAWLRKEMRLVLVGPRSKQSFEYEDLGDTLNANSFSSIESILKDAQRPMLIVGQRALLTSQSLLNAVLHLTKQYLIKDNWCGFNMLPLTASMTGALMMGYRPFQRPSIKGSDVVFLLNADDAVISSIPDDAFVIYQGHHGDAGARRANLVLPSAAYTEKSATWVNMEGRPQQSRAAVPCPGEAREDWQIIRALNEFVTSLRGSRQDTLKDFDSRQGGRFLVESFNDVNAVRMAIASEYPDLAILDAVPQFKIAETLKNLPKLGFTDATPLKTSIGDYYMTDCISRNSPTMAKCSLAFNSDLKFKHSDDLEQLSF